MEKIFRVEGLEFNIDDDGNLRVKSEHDTWTIPFEEGVDLLKSLRDEQLQVLDRKEFERSNWFDKLFSRYQGK